jgi:hypothetical protein
MMIRQQTTKQDNNKVQKEVLMYVTLGIENQLFRETTVTDKCLAVGFFRSRGKEISHENGKAARNRRMENRYG